MARSSLACFGAFAALAALLAGCARERPDADAWHTLPLGTDAAFHDACFTDSLNGWIVGGGIGVQGGIVGRTRDGGRTWDFTSGIAQQGPGVFSFHLNAVHFFDANTGLAGTDGGRIFVTRDGGRNWRLVRHGRGPADHVFDLQMLDRDFGYAVGLCGVLQTRDGGESWTNLTRPGSDEEAAFAHAVAFLDAQHGYKVGQHGLLEATSDGGRHWVRWDLPLPPGEKPYLFDIHFVDAFNGWIVGENGTLLRTADGGRHWQRQETGLPDAKERPRPPGSVPGPPGIEEIEGPLAGLFLTRVRFADPSRGWATGFWSDQGRSVVLGTRDGGETWAIEAEAAGEELRALEVHADGRAWAVGDRSREGAQTLLLRPATAR